MLTLMTASMKCFKRSSNKYLTAHTLLKYLSWSFSGLSPHTSYSASQAWIAVQLTASKFCSKLWCSLSVQRA